MSKTEYIHCNSSLFKPMPVYWNSLQMQYLLKVFMSLTQDAFSMEFQSANKVKQCNHLSFNPLIQHTYKLEFQCANKLVPQEVFIVYKKS